MRINLTKEEIVNSIYMQIGYSKKISETLLEDFFNIILESVIEHTILKKEIKLIFWRPKNQPMVSWLLREVLT